VASDGRVKARNLWLSLMVQQTVRFANSQQTIQKWSIIIAVIRPILEAFLRVAYPQHFLPGNMLGQFAGLCRQRLSAGTQILSTADLQELSDLTDYANQFHHDTNPGGWRTVIINDAQLLGFVQRTLDFVKRP
jgi:hypothetical protein